jgi:hypothetical protein
VCEYTAGLGGTVGDGEVSQVRCSSPDDGEVSRIIEGTFEQLQNLAFQSLTFSVQLLLNFS